MTRDVTRWIVAEPNGRGGSRPLDDEHVRRDLADPGAPVGSASRQSVVSREKEEHGGVKIGSAFFGWLDHSLPQLSKAKHLSQET